MVVHARFALAKNGQVGVTQRQLPGREFSTVTDKRIFVARDEPAENDAAPGSLEHHRWRP